MRLRGLRSGSRVGLVYVPIRRLWDIDGRFRIGGLDSMCYVMCQWSFGTAGNWATDLPFTAVALEGEKVELVTVWMLAVGANCLYVRCCHVGGRRVVVGKVRCT